MAVTEAKRNANDRYNAKCDSIIIRPLKQVGDRIRAAAKASGKSLQGYILDAVDEQIKRDEGGEEMPQTLMPNLIRWLKEHGHSDDDIVQCLESLGS